MVTPIYRVSYRRKSRLPGVRRIGSFARCFNIWQKNKEKYLLEVCYNPQEKKRNRRWGRAVI